MWSGPFYQKRCSAFKLRIQLHMASIEESFSKQDIRMIMKFLFLQGKRPPEIYKELEGVFKNNSPSEQTVGKWFRLFEEGRASVEDHELRERPSEASSSEIVEQVKVLLAEDRRQTCKELAERADDSAGSIYTILHRDLDKQKRQQLLENGVILFRDNAPAHITKSFLDMLDAWD